MLFNKKSLSFIDSRKLSCLCTFYKVDLE